MRRRMLRRPRRAMRGRRSYSRTKRRGSGRRRSIFTGRIGTRF